MRGCLTLKSTAPKDYQSLPRLAPPAGYVCVIRDIDSGCYRIASTAQPKPYIQDILSSAGRNFGIELVALLETPNLAAAEADLGERYQARLSDDWLELDHYQLAELRRSSLQIDTFPSQYLVPRSVRNVRQATPSASRLSEIVRPKSEYRWPNRGRWKRWRSRAPLPERRYGANSLRRNQEPSPEGGVCNASSRDVASDMFENALVNHPGKVIGAILLVLLIGLVWLSQHNYYFPLQF